MQELAYWLELIKQYGPLVGLFIAFIIWQARKIDQLLDRNSEIYEKEIERLAKVQDQLLTKLLGPQPSSLAAPTMEQIRQNMDQGKSKKGGG